MIPVRNTSLFARHIDVTKVRNGRAIGKERRYNYTLFNFTQDPSRCNDKRTKLMSREERAAARFTSTLTLSWKIPPMMKKK